MCIDFQCLWIGPQSTAGTWSFCATRCSRFWPGECCSRSKFSFVQRDDKHRFFVLFAGKKISMGSISFSTFLHVPTILFTSITLVWILKLGKVASAPSYSHICHYTVCVCVEKLSIFGLKIDPAGSHPWNVVHKLYVVATFKTLVSIYCPAWLSQV